MSKTFDQLGIPFPLFQGPVDDASEYCGQETCSFCQGDDLHCFDLEIGCAVMAACPACGLVTGLDADDRTGAACRKCQTPIEFPDLDDEIKICHTCLRAGKAAITKETELGMISWEATDEGPLQGEAAEIPPKAIIDLLHTPTYLTLQSDMWQFCCKQPMVYLGNWSRKQFTQIAPDKNGKRFFEEIVQDVDPDLWKDEMGDETGVYVFRCPACKRMTAHWDMA